ncbi:hypothetical protein SDJN02_22644, partial [Cucurbita argyrosperma subsp. argyrosperma]
MYDNGAISLVGLFMTEKCREFVNKAIYNKYINRLATNKQKGDSNGHKSNFGDSFPFENTIYPSHSVT